MFLFTFIMLENILQSSYKKPCDVREILTFSALYNIIWSLFIFHSTSTYTTRYRVVSLSSKRSHSYKYFTSPLITLLALTLHPSFNIAIIYRLLRLSWDLTFLTL